MLRTFILSLFIVSSMINGKWFVVETYDKENDDVSKESEEQNPR